MRQRKERRADTSTWREVGYIQSQLRFLSRLARVMEASSWKKATTTAAPWGSITGKEALKMGMA